jgi:uncharacterized protein (TIGR02271 family)
MATMGELAHGMKVRSSDGASLGKIIRVEPDHFLVEKGFFFPKDYAIPVSMIREIRDDEAWLSVTKAELEREDASFGQGLETREEGADAEGRMDRGAGYAAARGEYAPTEGTTRRDEGRLTLSEEELEARKRVREVGDVQLRKEVVTEHRQIDVPVTKEEVHVERVPASASTSAEGDAFEEKTIRVPVREEEVEVTKRPRVREEVRVSKTQRQHEQRVEGEVRREEARVERTDDPTKPRGYGIDDDEPR